MQSIFYILHVTYVMRYRRIGVPVCWLGCSVVVRYQIVRSIIEHSRGEHKWSIIGCMLLSNLFTFRDFTHAWTKSFGMNKGRLRDRKGGKGEEFELRSYPLHLDCPFLLTTPMAGSCDSPTKTQTGYLCTAVWLCLVPRPDTRTSRFLQGCVL